MDWLLADAKNRFSEVVTLALTQGPQRVRRREQSVVILAEAEYARLTGASSSFKDYLVHGPDFVDLDLIRSNDTMRDVLL
jgi:hypothetical protein